MSSLAEILHRKGYKVSGYDCCSSPATDHLKELGIPVYHQTEKETTCTFANSLFLYI
ncbi:MAG: hypothetical protein J6Q67_04690 [Clostridia bacterium]|nr:hypothetical protein [Clostridia bacterium]